MNSINEIKQKILGLSIAEDSNPKSIEDVTALLKSITDIEKANAEINKNGVEINNSSSAQKTENIRFWFTTVATLISTLIVCLTLYFQIEQSRANNDLQRQATEDTQWRELLSNFSNAKMQDNLAMPSMIKSFYKSKRYGNEARELAVMYMPQMGSVANDFNFLFDDFYKRTNKSNYKDLVRLAQIIYKEAAATQSNIDGYNDWLKKQPYPVLESSKIQQEKSLVSDLNNKMGVVALALSHFIKDSLKTDLNENIDLSNVSFYGTDLSDVDFKNFNLMGSDLGLCDISNADLSQVIDINQTRWDQTAWWRAKKLNTEIVSLLNNVYPYNSAITYANFTNRTYSDSALYEGVLLKYK